MNDSLLIRTLQESDAAEVLAYTKSIGSESNFLSFGEEGIPVSVEAEAAFIKKYQNDRISGMWCVEHNHDIIGLCSFDANTNKRMAHRAGIALSVRKKYWHQGIGSLMMKKLISHAEKHPEITMLTLEVICDNKHAIHLYERFGFTICGCMHRFFHIGNSDYDAYFMECDLTKRKEQYYDHTTSN